MKISTEQQSNSKLIREQAQNVISELQLHERISTSGELSFTGSYELDLMVWKDIDCYITFDSEINAIKEFYKLIEIFFNLSGVSKIKLINFYQNPRLNMPQGLYCGISYCSKQFGIWKVDIWNLSLDAENKNKEFLKNAKSRLNPETKDLILYWKYKLLNNKGRLPHLASYYLYQAILFENIRKDQEIINYFKKNNVLLV